MRLELANGPQHAFLLGLKVLLGSHYLPDGDLIVLVQEQGLAVGYYLVRQSDSKRFFISTVVDLPAFEKICSEALSDASGWDYYVEKSFGPDVNGDPAWSNLDYTDRFVC